MHKIPVRLFTVADHVKPGIFLHRYPQECGIGLGLLYLAAFGLPLRPGLVGL